MIANYHSVTLDYKTNRPIISFSFKDKEVLDHLEEYIGDLDIDIKKHREKRSLDANAYFHVLINQMARKLGTSDSEMKTRMNLEYGTVARNIDDTKVGIKVPYGTNVEQFYPYCKKFGECVENGMTFEKYLLYKQTHELNTKEMSDLISGVVEECKKLGIETKTKEELDSMLSEWKI